MRLRHGTVAGVYALCAAQVALSRKERTRLGGVHHRTQPAILLAQFAQAGGSPGIGEELLSHAVDTAHLALAYIVATVLVVDPDGDGGYEKVRRPERIWLAQANQRVARMWSCVRAATMTWADNRSA